MSLTLVAAVLELGVVVVLVGDEHGDLADADEGFLGHVGGGDRQGVLSLALTVKTHRADDHTYRYTHTQTHGDNTRLARAHTPHTE